ncbi:hypothetical protein FJZ31_09500 [Candidatus Poribacteria bacterium]|nr:hypothetical protein [Candidatus Poribacteria bacterium]
MAEIVLETQEQQLVLLYRKLPEGKKREALDFFFDLVEKEADEVSPSQEAKAALLELCKGLGEGPEDLASNHDYYLYGARKRK